MKRYIDEIESNLSCPTSLGRIISDMIASGAVGRHVSGLLREIAGGNPKHLRETNVTEMALHRSPDFLLYVRRFGGAVDHVSELSGTEDYLRTVARSGVSVIGSAAPVMIERLCLSDDRARLIRGERRRHDGGPIFETLGSDIIEDIVPVEGPVWMVRLNHGPIAHETSFYDRVTLERAFTAAAHGELSSLVSLCQVFGASRDRAALDYLEQLSRHDAYFVRWAAIQSAGRIDGAAARTMLASALDDPHPAIRSSAGRALGRELGRAGTAHV
jgi:hypothetical protein